jgi:AbiEi antitoxin C-terminal domain/Protein of unknown function (DUF559)
VSAARLRRLVDSGELVAIRRGVYARAEALDGRNPRRVHAVHVAAAWLVSHDTASHESAAMLHGLDLLGREPRETVTVTRPPGSRGSRSSRNDIKVHAAELPRGHVTTRYGLPVTTPARTAIDIARDRPFMNGVVTTDSALRDRKTSKTALAAVLDACSGWPGTLSAQRVLEFSDGRAESALESCARVIFAEHGLPPPQLQTEIYGQEFIGRVDFYWPEYNTIAEADGLMKYNKTPALATDQLERDQLLREAGYKVVHFTWHQLFQQTLRVISWVKVAFARSTPE